ncbi:MULTISPECIES: potassium channel family protein [Micromonospora]|uniref:Two pore domain potassium channel family protein n=1 Tax=Micromonospora solifontis TaxID=2487138 RepID=A0ABX9WL38_9ACTN|nr:MULTISPECIES: potassium channel family protein [Micromonospora]NES14923.1 two pore domain potassium channel family protein [Micromonospora sp. PPF5-17B]NES35154.1 two pore domain potassium channel family protein [Micromonospora solifontis]NES55149.1 two pore domain potassium channel family protein [Micromonospora sp. PPF5-6]RNM01137.1 two pore domain potassium channel family protein [Micromonospora solifontis]
MVDESFRRERWLAMFAVALLLVAYFAVPVEPDPNGLRLALRSAGTLLLVVVVAFLVTGQVRRQLAVQQPTGEAEIRALIRLAVALIAGLLVFALADFVVANTRPGEFVGLRTRVDALYFALTTLTTVGYGDVHAQGQIARVLVCAQMIFSIGVIATGASIVIKQMTQRPRPGRG